MTSYGAVEQWGPRMQVPGSAHLTRRGRLLRAGLVLALVVMAGLWVLGRLTAEPVRAESSSPAPAAATVRVTVEDGDSLWSIARASAPAADPREVVLDIRELNGLPSNLIHPGQVLIVPAQG